MLYPLVHAKHEDVPPLVLSLCFLCTLGGGSDGRVRRLREGILREICRRRRPLRFAGLPHEPRRLGGEFFFIFLFFIPPLFHVEGCSSVYLVWVAWLVVLGMMAHGMQSRVVFFPWPKHTISGRVDADELGCSETF